VERNEILVEQHLLWLDILESGVKILLIDKPRTTVICENLLGDELLVVFVRICKMLEVLPAKPKGSAFAVLPYQILHPHSQIIIINQMPAQNHLIESPHEHSQPGKNIFPFSGNGCATNKRLSFQSLRTTLILLVAFSIENGDALCPHHQNPSIYGQLWNLLDILL